MEGNYEIRLESIGGLGANLCGKMLGELGVKYLNLNGMNFSSYGSEKTGTPVKGYIRYCHREKELWNHTSVRFPDLLVVFHRALLQEEDIWRGCSEKTDLLLAAGEEKREEIEKLLKERAKRQENFGFRNLYLVPAAEIAGETKSRINAVMLGAVVRVMETAMRPLLSGEKGEHPEAERLEMGKAARQAANSAGEDSLLKQAEQICRDALGRKYPAALPGNLEGVRRGYRETMKTEGVFFGQEEGNAANGNPVSKTRKERGGEGEGSPWGYETAPIGGVNPDFGSTVISDLSPSRQGYIPLFIKERCINCGLCDSTCPDMVFQFEKGIYKGREMMVNRGLDYYHCKGCLRCVEVCPVNALVRGLEEEHPHKAYFLPNQELLRNPDYYRKAGPDGYLTSEAFLDEKREEGGEV